ncbi:MAG: hypothetical protein Q9219_007115 [cf. Caloplaca sp. 3 TL-2023]
MDHHQNPPQGAVPPYEPNPSYVQPQMQHHECVSSYNNQPIQQYPQQPLHQQPMASPPMAEQKHEYYPTQAAVPQHQTSNTFQQMPMQQSQYQTATPLINLSEGAAPVDCPCCHMRALTRTEYHSGNTTK